MSAPAPALQQIKFAETAQPARRKIDLWLIAGIVIAIGAVLAGIASAGIRVGSLFQPTGMLIVLGGTLGVTFITTPRLALYRAVRRAIALLWTEPENREILMEELVALSKTARSKGLFGIELIIGTVERPFLRESLQAAMDTRNRTELQTTLEMKLVSLNARARQTPERSKWRADLRQPSA